MIILSLINKNKYKLISSISVLISAINLSLLYINYYEEKESGIYLMTQSVIFSVQLLVGMLISQFIFHYIKYRRISIKASENFFISSLNFSVLIGILIFFNIYFFSESIILLFLNGLNSVDASNANSILKNLSYSLIFIFANSILQGFFNANKKLMCIYVISLIPITITLIALCIGNLVKIEINYLALIYSFGHAIAFIFGIIISNTKFNHRGFNGILDLIHDSCRIKFGHNIHNFTLLYIINNCISQMNLEISLLFIYTKKIADAFLAVINEPLGRHVIVDLIGNPLNSNKTLRVIKKYRKELVINYSIITILTFMFSLGYIVYFKSDSISIFYIYYFLLLFILSNLVIGFEYPYSIFILNKNYARPFYFANIIFILILIILVYIFGKIWLPTIVPLGILIGQFSNLIILSQFSKKIDSRG